MLVLFCSSDALVDVMEHFLVTSGREMSMLEEYFKQALWHFKQFSLKIFSFNPNMFLMKEQNFNIVKKNL